MFKIIFFRNRKYKRVCHNFNSGDNNENKFSLKNSLTDRLKQ